MSFSSFLFQGEPPASVTSTTSSTASLPAWYQDYMRGVLAKGDAVASEPFVQYGGQRIAEFTPDQEAGMQGTRDAVGNWMPGMAAANEASTRGAAAYDPNQVNNFMSPYLGGVVDEIGRLGTERFNEQVMPGVNSTFTGAGQFGSTRNMEMMARGMRDNQRETQGQQRLALQQGHEAAMKDYGSFQDRALTGGTNLGNLAKAQQQMSGVDNTAQLGIGQIQQSFDQGNLDLGYRDFTEQRDYPREMTNYLANLTKGTTFPQSSTSQTTAPYTGNNMSTSPLGQIAGLFGALKGANVFKRGGVVTMARGGRVQPPAMRGPVNYRRMMSPLSQVMG